LQEIIQSLPPTAFLVMLAFLVGMGGIALAAGLQARRRASLIEATETSQIGSAQDGYRELEGTIEAVDGRTLRAPLTGWRVCWYRARVEKYVSTTTRTRGSTWRSVRSMTSGAPFLLRDSTGICIVRPYNAEVTPTDKSVWYGAGPEPDDRNPPRLAPTQSSTPMMEIAGGTSHQYRYTEERIYDGDPLLVLGQFSSDPAARAMGSEAQDNAAESEDVASAESAGQPDTVSALDEEDALEDLAVRITGASIGKGPGKPFILSTTPQASHVAMTEFGSEAAIYLALIPFGLAALLLWTRFQ
jgi:hypothetical protein